MHRRGGLRERNGGGGGATDRAGGALARSELGARRLELLSQDNAFVDLGTAFTSATSAAGASAGDDGASAAGVGRKKRTPRTTASGLRPGTGGGGGSAPSGPQDLSLFLDEGFIGGAGTSSASATATGGATAGSALSSSAAGPAAGRLRPKGLPPGLARVTLTASKLEQQRRYRQRVAELRAAARQYALGEVSGPAGPAARRRRRQRAREIRSGTGASASGVVVGGGGGTDDRGGSDGESSSGGSSSGGGSDAGEHSDALDSDVSSEDLDGEYFADYNYTATASKSAAAAQGSSAALPLECYNDNNYYCQEELAALLLQQPPSSLSTDGSGGVAGTMLHGALSSPCVSSSPGCVVKTEDPDGEQERAAQQQQAKDNGHGAKLSSQTSSQKRQHQRGRQPSPPSAPRGDTNNRKTAGTVVRRDGKTPKEESAVTVSARGDKNKKTTASPAAAEAEAEGEEASLHTLLLAQLTEEDSALAQAAVLGDAARQQRLVEAWVAAVLGAEAGPRWLTQLQQEVDHSAATDATVNTAHEQEGRTDESQSSSALPARGKTNSSRESDNKSTSEQLQRLEGSACALLPASVELLALCPSLIDLTTPPGWAGAGAGAGASGGGGDFARTEAEYLDMLLRQHASRRRRHDLFHRQSHTHTHTHTQQQQQQSKSGGRLGKGKRQRTAAAASPESGTAAQQPPAIKRTKTEAAGAETAASGGDSKTNGGSAETVDNRSQHQQQQQQEELFCEHVRRHHCLQHTRHALASLGAVAARACRPRDHHLCSVCLLPAPYRCQRCGTALFCCIDCHVAHDATRCLKFIV